MGTHRADDHVAAFNAAVISGDWDTFAARFTDGARMEFVGVPVGPFVGRTAIAAAYAQQPPTDTMVVRELGSDGAADTLRFAWTSGGEGTLRIRWEGDRVDELVVAFDET